MDKYTIQLDRRVLRQLGAQLYGDTPSVIAELVANSYDADAHNVWITVDTKENNIFVEDDGRGMDPDDINNAFLNIGYDKRVGNEITSLGRKIMGRKGIGKLATFSLTNLLRVLSAKDGKWCGCVLDFKRITESGDEPQAIPDNEVHFNEDKLSETKSGTRLELIGVKKKVALSYRFIVKKLIRTFDVNCSDFNIHIRENDKPFKLLKRSDLNFFSIMDTIIIIGDEHLDQLKAVQENSIASKYKSISTYSDFLQNKNRGRVKLKEFPYKIEVEDSAGNECNIDFSLHGWIGTVDALPHLRDLSDKVFDDMDFEDDDRITINDNRISLYSLGKLGEYDILTKIKNNRNMEAYVIGELFVDVFEESGLADMAISNRRGYEESDTRYTETIKIAKRLVGCIIDEKDLVEKAQKDDEQAAAEAREAEEIKAKFWSNSRTKTILQERLSKEEKETVESENLQFTRAVNSDNATKRIFISHTYCHRLYGQFIVDVLEQYGIDVKSTVIFTSDRRLGVPQGKDIYDYLKSCFRDDLLCIFLFSKAFYDSNICIAEAGAAWATNKSCLNVIIDVKFEDIDKPSNNALSSIKFRDIRTEDQQLSLIEFFTTIIDTVLKINTDIPKLKDSIKIVLRKLDYSDEAINNPESFYPKRKFQPHPICPNCHNRMDIIYDGKKIIYKCSNVSCHNSLRLQLL